MKVTGKDVKKMSIRTSLSQKTFVSVTFLLLAATAILAACGSSSSGTAIASSSSSATAGHPGSGFGGGPVSGGGSNARSGPASGGASGTVDSVSTSSFTMLTSAGQKVTVDEASAITTGECVLVLGTVSGTTITATQVIVQPTGGCASATSSAAGVIPFQPGAPSTSKQVGQIPANYIEGSGTIVSGTTANKATEAALAAYPGGVVDRVVQLSNGEYEAHNIGVNWPHHVFVNQDFKVVGAN